MKIDKDNIKIILILLVVSLSLGYAYINSDLNINGTAQVNHANWDVHWANIQITNGSVTGSNVVTAPTISNETTVNYSISLPIPGSFYEFTVDAVNGGQIDAMIDTIDSKLNGTTITTLPAYLKYTVTYANDEPLQANQELKANTTETYKVRIEYNEDIELNQIPTTNQNLTLQFTVTYRQATDDSTPVTHYLYRVSENGVNTGDNVSALGTTYATYQELINTLGDKAFLKHGIQDSKIVSSHAGLFYNNTVYWLIGEGATYNSSTSSYNPDSIYYEQNKSTLQNIFESSNCTTNYSGEKECYGCVISNARASACSDGQVFVRHGAGYCGVEANGYSSCAAN